MDNPDSLDNLEKLGYLEPKVCLDQRAILDLKGSKDQQDFQDKLAHKVRQVSLVILVPLDQPDQLAIQDR